jgi:hypothetical protein
MGHSLLAAICVEKGVYVQFLGGDNLPPLQIPWEQDCQMMLALVDQGFNEDELICLNWVRCHQHVLFVPDVFDASGRALDQQYLTRRPTSEVWLTPLFARESPPHQDFHLWQRALHLFTPQGRAKPRLGSLIAKGHKIWDW